MLYIIHIYIIFRILSTNYIFSNIFENFCRRIPIVQTSIHRSIHSLSNDKRDFDQVKFIINLKISRMKNELTCAFAIGVHPPAVTWINEFPGCGCWILPAQRFAT